MHIHTAILDVAVIAGGLVMISAALRQLILEKAGVATPPGVGRAMLPWTGQGFRQLFS